METMRVLDSHLHLWDPAVLRYDWLEGRLLRRFGADELHTALLETPTAERAAVFVQAECVATDSLREVDWVDTHAATTGVRAIVARAPVDAGSAVRDHLAQLRTRPLVVGVRRILQDEAPGFALSPAFVDGARAVAEHGYTFDACIRHPQLAQVTALADAVPHLRIVLDHLGKPEVHRAPDPSWAAALHDLAARPQVSCKLSGLPAESGGTWMPHRWLPLLDTALSAFGPTRLLFGSDWPVSWPYAAWEGFVREWAEASAPAHVDDIMWGNAARFYGIT